MRKRLLFTAAVLFGLVPRLGSQPAKKASLASPLTPQEAVKHFRLADQRLRIELVACEPQIESPVAMAFDENGRLWVVEMRDYPNGPAKGELPAGRIRILEDRNGDGFFEHSTIFADKLLFANGLLPWKGGVVVTAAPHILYLKDTDGDAKADVKEVLYEGFATQNPQLRVSSPILGLDGWIYVVNGLRGGQVIRAGKKNAKPISLAGMDFRFDLLADRAEAISGLGQYGNTFDDWGNRFVCDNRHHLRHVVIDNRYLKRNPYLAASGVVEDISELDDGPLSSGGKIYPISSNWTTSNLHEGRFTAACGVFVYRDALLPKSYQGAAFTCDPTGNLVHVERIEQKGATFHSKPIFKEKEFLASPDDWFRPVFLCSGPDGALYMVDMYRAVIEHPEFMPPELKNRPDLTLGKDKGRIWRIVQAERDRRPLWTAAGASFIDLGNRLASPNAWQRITAQRVLLERIPQEKDDKLPVVLGNMAVMEQVPPVARLHAAWLLERFAILPEQAVGQMLKSASPRVREQAVVLAERRLRQEPARQKQLLALADDPDPRVRFQMALTLGEWDDPQIIEPLARIALAGSEDRWTRLAVASAVPHRGFELVSRVLNLGSFSLPPDITPGRLLLVEELLAMVGARNDRAEIETLLCDFIGVGFRGRKDEEALVGQRRQARQKWLLAGMNGLCQGLSRRGVRLETVLQGFPKQTRIVSERTASILQDLAKLAEDPKRERADRIATVRLLAHVEWKTAQPALTRLIREEPLQDIRLAAVRALSAHAQPEVPNLLMEAWRSYTPAVRREVTEAMFRDAARIDSLLAAIEAKRIRPGDLDALRTRQLVNHPRPEIRKRARKLLAEHVPADRKDVLARYQKALDLKGDAKKGRDIFQKHCATCHRIAGIGIDVAPDISDTRTKTTAALLMDILNPNAAIDNNYINYVVTTKGGRTLSGVLAAETASSLTLRRAEGQSDIVLRQDVDEIQSTGVSLMPEGLEKNITIAEMADLLSFLKNWRYLDGAVPIAP